MQSRFEQGNDMTQYNSGFKHTDNGGKVAGVAKFNGRIWVITVDVRGANGCAVNAAAKDWTDTAKTRLEAQRKAVQMMNDYIVISNEVTHILAS